MNNPYTSRMGLPDEQMFVGRKAELRQVLDHLAAPKPSSVAILGASRIGKTSLMEQVQREVQKLGRADLAVAVVPPASVKDRASVFRKITQAIAKARGLPMPAEERAYEPDGFSEWLAEAVGEATVLLFMDDFDDWIFPSDVLRFEMYTALRAALWQQKLGICLTTRHPVADLCQHEGKSASLLWNVFTTVEPGLLTRAEARDLVLKPHAGAGITVTDEEWDLVFTEAGPHPCLLQIAAYHLFDARQKSPEGLTQEQLYFLQQKLQKDIRPCFPLFVDYLRTRDPQALETARMLAANQAVDRDQGQRLADLGLAYATPRGVRLLSEAFARFLQQAEGGAVKKTEPAAAQAPRVFLCHASADRKFSEKLCRDLIKAGVDVWADWLKIAPGQQYDRAIQTALRAASHIVLVVSPSAVDSSYVRSEIEWALAYKREVIPVICVQVELLPRWHTLQYLEATTPAKYQQTVVALAGLLPRR